MARVFLLAILAVGFCASRLVIADEPAPTEPSREILEQLLRASLQQRTAWARKALEAAQAAFDSGTITLDGAIRAATQLVDAEVAAASNDRQKIVAIEKHVAWMDKMAERIQGLYDDGARGGEPGNYYTIKRECESARIMLLKAQIAAK